jgi:hypothetical protein
MERSPISAILYTCVSRTTYKTRSYCMLGYLPSSVNFLAVWQGLFLSKAFSRQFVVNTRHWTCWFTSFVHSKRVDRLSCYQIARYSFCPFVFVSWQLAFFVSCFLLLHVTASWLQIPSLKGEVSLTVRFQLMPWVTLPSQWFLAPARLYAYQPLLQRAQIPEVSSKEGAVIGAVLSTRKLHRGRHQHQTHE